MNTMTPRKLMAAIAMSSALVALAGCASNSSSPVAFVEDTVITTKVKAKFAEADDVSASALQVETINGTVLLRGVAKDAHEKAEAERIARSVEGVRSVNNRIDVRSS